MPLTTESALRKDRLGLAPMQHRHFATIAAIIAKRPLADREAFAWHFAHHLGETNPRFDQARFLRACGVED